MYKTADRNDGETTITDYKRVRIRLHSHLRNTSVFMDVLKQCQKNNSVHKICIRQVQSRMRVRI